MGSMSECILGLLMIVDNINKFVIIIMSIFD